MPNPPRVSALCAIAALTISSLTVGVSPASAETVHVVAAGDTLSVIAAGYGVSTADLAAANGITNTHLIRVGESLTVPVAAPATHTVAPGESVSVIANAYGISSADLATANGLTDVNRIKVGQELLLPTGAGAPAPAAPEAVNPVSNYPSLPSRIVDNPDRAALIPSFERWAAHYGVPQDLLMAVAYQESGWQTSVVSHKGAIGVGQILPGTATWIANDLIGIPELDPNVADDNIRMSARFLLWLIGHMGDEPTALAGYYQGPTSVNVRGQYEDTKAYVAAVSAGRSRFQRG